MYVDTSGPCVGLKGPCIGSEKGLFRPKTMPLPTDRGPLKQKMVHFQSNEALSDRHRLFQANIGSLSA